MKRSDFVGALPPMPDAFLRRMERTLGEKEAYTMKKRHARSMILAFALLGALLLAGSAFALTKSGLLSYLFYGQNPPAEAAELISVAGEEARGGGITVRLEEYLYDGDAVALSYTISADGDEPLLVGGDGGYFFDLAGADGEPVDVDSGWGEPWDGLLAMGGAVDGTALDQAVACGMQGVTSRQSQGGPLDLRISVNVYRPLRPLVASDQPADEDALVCMNSIVGADSAHNEALLASSGLEWTHVGAMLEEMGLIEKIATVTLRQRLEPKVAQSASAREITQDAPIVIELDDCTLTIEGMRFTTARAEYALIVQGAPGASRQDPALQRWLWSGLHDQNGDHLSFNMGGSGQIAPDGRMSFVMHYTADPFAQMPAALLLYPQKDGYEPKEGDTRADSYDPVQAIRLEIRDGKVMPPALAAPRAVTYADDFFADEPGDQRPLYAQSRHWDQAALADALLDGEAFHFDDTGDYRGKDGTVIISEKRTGRFAFCDKRLPDAYRSSLMLVGSNRPNLGGAIEGFSVDQALDILDQRLSALGLARGRVAYATAYTPQALQDAYVELQMARYAGITDPDIPSAESLRAVIESAAAPKGGYLFTLSLQYGGLNCVLEDKFSFVYGNDVPLGSGIEAFVTPDGALYIETPNRAAIYDVSDPKSGDAPPPLSIDEAKRAVEQHIQSGSGPAIQIACALYEYAPAYPEKEGGNLTLCPAWNFYAERPDGALYLIHSVDAATGDILR